MVFEKVLDYNYFLMGLSMWEIGEIIELMGMVSWYLRMGHIMKDFLKIISFNKEF